MKYKDYGTYVFAIVAVIIILSYKLFYNDIKDISRNFFSTSSVLLLMMLSVFLIIIVASIFNKQSSNSKKK